jgi:hypothetical protein
LSVEVLRARAAIERDPAFEKPTREGPLGTRLQRP